MRIRLARALEARGILSNAEVHGLVATLDRPRRDLDDLDLPHGASARSASDQLQIALSRLPMDCITPESASAALRHTKEVLLSYCKEWRTFSQGNISGNNTSRHHTVTPIDQVANMILQSFASCVMINGTDECYHAVEQGLVSILIVAEDELGDESHSDSKAISRIQDISRALMDRIQHLCSPPLVDYLSPIHVLSICRFVSYLPSKSVEKIVAGSIIACATSASSPRGSCGLSTIPKLMATYLRLISMRYANSKVSASRTMTLAMNSSCRQKETNKDKHRIVLQNFEQNLKNCVEQRLQELNLDVITENELDGSNDSSTRKFVVSVLTLFLRSTSILLTSAPVTEYRK